MPGNELLYSHPSVLIALVLLLAILLSNQLGFRLGQWSRRRANEAVVTQANAIQAATLGLLALLLGFSFSMALNRHDARVQSVVAEANTIGTARLRATLLPEPQRSLALAVMNDYLELRLSAAQVSLDREDERNAFNRRATALQDQLWEIARAAAEVDPGPVRSGLYLQSLNEMFDAQASRNAALEAHVPELVLMLLFGVFAISGGILGYSGGLEGGRPRTATLLMSTLIVLVVFLIIDLDRPRRGLIQVPQTAMEALRAPAT